MATTREITAEMDALEEEARALLANPGLTPIERRLAFDRLLARYRVLEEYRRALNRIAELTPWAYIAATLATADNPGHTPLSTPDSLPSIIPVV